MSKRKLNTDLSAVERSRNLKLERQARAREEQASLDDTFAQVRELGEERGEEFEQAPQKRGEQRKPMRRLSGLGWLLGKSKITEAQYEAGLRYGEAYRRVAGQNAIRSILDRDPSGSGGCAIAAMLANSEAHVYAAERLKMYRGMLGNHRWLIEACDAICGLEKTPREVSINGVAAQVQEALVIVGLDLMIQHLAPARTSGGENAPDVAIAA